MNAVNRIMGEASWRITDPGWSYYYAKDTIKGRFPEGEPHIAKDPGWAYYYALNIIGGRWPEAEAMIATDTFYALVYAKNVIEGRWPEVESSIANSEFRHDYLYYFPEAKDDWVLNGWLDWLDS